MGIIKHFKKIFSLYDDLIAVDMSKDVSEDAMFFPHEPNRIGVDMSCFSDGNNIGYAYLLESLPDVVPMNFKEIVRSECRHGVKVHFINKVQGHNIQWDSPEMKAKLGMLRRIEVDKEGTDIDEFNLHENVTSLGQSDRVKSSLRYLSYATLRRRRSMLKVSMAIYIVGVRGVAFDTSVQAITRYMADIGIKMSRVLYEVQDVLTEFAPFRFEGLDDAKKIGNIPSFVLPDEILSAFSSYNQGIIGKKGEYWGTDILSNFPVLKEVKKTNVSAENILICGETGSGKSMYVKGLLLQLIALNFVCTIMDVEGFEYSFIGDFLKRGSTVKTVNMGEGSGKYFDPLEIPKPTGIPDIDESGKRLASSFTVAVLKVLLGAALTEDIWLDIVVNDMVSETYSSAGVSEDPDTWVNSEGLSLKSVYCQLQGMKRHRDDENYSTAVEKAIAILGKYFLPDGANKGVFDSRIVLDDIRDADLLICSFGMAGKTETSIDPIQLALMQLSAAQISYQRSIFSKARGKFNLKVWEELQRWGNFSDSDKTLGTAITGGRKLGDANIMITNNVQALLNNDAFGLLGNKTSYAIGAIDDAEVRARLCSRLSIEHLAPELEHIAINRKVKDDFSADETKGVVGKKNSPYTFSFLLGLDGVDFAVARMEFSKEMASLPLFETGIDTSLAQK